MFRILFILFFGVAIGYFMGYKDGRTHDQNVVSRLVERVGGSARSSVGNDIDTKYDKAGK